MKSPALGALVALAVGGALGCHGDRSYSAGPAALVEDGSHGSGNAFFFWLPPLLNQQAPAEQVFSEQLRPTVTISNLCSGEVIRTFSGADVQIADAAYHANWHTTEDVLDPSCTYRIAVQTGSRQLGVADVDVVDDGSELKNVDTDEYLALLDDRMRNAGGGAELGKTAGGSGIGLRLEFGGDSALANRRGADAGFFRGTEGSSSATGRTTPWTAYPFCSSNSAR